MLSAAEINKKKVITQEKKYIYIYHVFFSKSSKNSVLIIDVRCHWLSMFTYSPTLNALKILTKNPKNWKFSCKISSRF